MGQVCGLSVPCFSRELGRTAAITARVGGMSALAAAITISAGRRNPREFRSRTRAGLPIFARQAIDIFRRF